MTNYIGPTGALATSPKYFYRLSRDDSGYLIFTKIDLNADTETVIINDNTLSTNEEDQIPLDLTNDTVVVNIDAGHEVIKLAGGYSQYKVKADDLVYFIDNDGNMILRINGSYNYPEIV